MEPGKGRDLGPRGRFGPRRPPSRDERGRKSRTYGRGTRLRGLAEDGVRLRGFETAAWQGAGSPPGRTWGPGALGAFPPLAGLPRGVSPAHFGAWSGEAGCLYLECSPFVRRPSCHFLEERIMPFSTCFQKLGLSHCGVIIYLQTLLLG